MLVLAQMISAVQILVTTACDRRCVDCCQGIPRKAPGEHGAWQDFEHAAKFVQGYPLTVCGGEATIHPEFKRIASEFREMFWAPYLELMSNGHGLIEHGDVLKCFDMVRVTNYPRMVTREAIEYCRRHIPDRLHVEIDTHIPRDHIGAGQACFRRFSPIVWNGWVYPCCVATGFDNAACIPLDYGWQEEIESVPLECSRCVFSSQGDV